MSLTQCAFVASSLLAAMGSALAVKLFLYVRSRTDGMVRKSLMNSLALLSASAMASCIAAAIGAMGILPFHRVAIFACALALMVGSLFVLAKFLLGGDGPQRRR